jgi:hypothetical protein
MLASIGMDEETAMAKAKKVATVEANSVGTAKVATKATKATKVAKAKPAKRETTSLGFSAEAPDQIVALLREVGEPVKIGVLRAKWTSEAADFAKLAPTQQKGIMRRAVRALVEAGTVAKNGMLFSIAGAKAKPAKVATAKAVAAKAKRPATKRAK